MKHIAADIGNSRFKLRFKDEIFSIFSHPDMSARLHSVMDTIQKNFSDSDFSDTFCWWISCVHRPTLARLQEWLQEARPQDKIQILNYTDLPLFVDVRTPQAVGMDRLLAAVAANKYRQKDRAAIIVDMGTAITTDLLQESGTFCGGAILPGINISAEALHHYTDALPRVSFENDSLPTVIGKDTPSALKSGIYWGTVGMIRELTRKISQNFVTPPHVFLTGGYAKFIAQGLSSDIFQDEKLFHYEIVPEMVLEGIIEVIKRKNP
ncbi:MAG: type III pantothenate kinase [Planctomycetia bacterium]|nr:type III pantothenate kinase [Planctomycetia bacterium]